MTLEPRSKVEPFNERMIGIIDNYLVFGSQESNLYNRKTQGAQLVDHSGMFWVNVFLWTLDFKGGRITISDPQSPLLIELEFP